MLSSCVSKKEIIYLQNDEINQEKVSNIYKTIFKSDDLLQIIINSTDFEAVRPFNLSSVVLSVSTNTVVSQPIQQLYLVDSEGNIEFPVFGKIKVAGLTRIELIDLLREKLSPDYVKDPSINITITNFKITVIGDVARPNTYTIPNERVTIIEAIGMAGDLTISGERSNVKVIREVNNKKVQYVVDLKSKKLLTSPVYYLQQNDVVYVEQNYARAQDAAYTRNTGLFISLASVLLSLITIITR